MAALFLLVFIAAIPVWLLGMIQPRWVVPQAISQSPTRRVVNTLYGSVTGASLLLFIILGRPSDDTVVDSTASSSSPESIEPSAPSESSAPTDSQIEETNEGMDSTDSDAATEETTAIAYATNGAGLGDSAQDFESVYGSNNGTSEQARYRNDYLLVFYGDGQAANILLQFEVTPEPRRSLSDALNAARPFLPSDAVQIDEWQEDNYQYVVQFESTLLADAYTPEWRDVFWGEGVNPGSIVVIFNHDDFDKNSVFAVIVAPGGPDNI
jgi:hypothetical protein